jgi:Lhr-like helicase
VSKLLKSVVHHISFNKVPGKNGKTNRDYKRNQEASYQNIGLIPHRKNYQVRNRTGVDIHPIGKIILCKKTTLEKSSNH